MNKYNYLFVCGSYRSGTSIMSIMLSHHSEIVMTDETWWGYDSPHGLNVFDGKIRRLKKAYPKLQVRPFIPYNLLGDRYGEFLDEMCKMDKIDKYVYEKKLIEYSGKKLKYFGDKLPEYVEEVPRLFFKYNNPKFIMCVRDPRDVIGSQLRKYGEYIERYGNVDCNWWAKKTVEECINMKRNWLYYIGLWDKYKSNTEYYEINYNHLVDNTEEEAKKIATFLGVESTELVSIFTNKVKKQHHQWWKEKMPNITDKLPKEWLKRMEEYGLEI